MPSKIEEWQARVLDENSELQKKIAALENFLATRPANVSDVEKILLPSQLTMMQGYARILKQRINSWPSLDPVGNPT